MRIPLLSEEYTLTPCPIFQDQLSLLPKLAKSSAITPDERKFVLELIGQWEAHKGEIDFIFDTYGTDWSSNYAKYNEDTKKAEIHLMKNFSYIKGDVLSPWTADPMAYMGPVPKTDPKVRQFAIIAHELLHAVEMVNIGRGFKHNNSWESVETEQRAYRIVAIIYKAYNQWSDLKLWDPRWKLDPKQWTTSRINKAVNLAINAAAANSVNAQGLAEERVLARKQPPMKVRIK